MDNIRFRLRLPDPPSLDVDEKAAVIASQRPISDFFFKGSVKKVPSNEGYIEAAHQLAEKLPVIDESTLVRTSDGVELIWFTKRGMFSPNGAFWELFYSFSMAAIRLLLQLFPPPLKLSQNKRHRNHLKKEKEHWEAKNCHYGVYV